MMESAFGPVPDDFEWSVALVKPEAEITDRYWDMLDATLPDQETFDDLPGGAGGRATARTDAPR